MRWDCVCGGAVPADPIWPEQEQREARVDAGEPGQAGTRRGRLRATSRKADYFMESSEVQSYVCLLKRRNAEFI